MLNAPLTSDFAECSCAVLGLPGDVVLLLSQHNVVALYYGCVVC